MNIIEAYNDAQYKVAGHGSTTTNLLVEAMMEKGMNLEKDVYGTGPIINDFEAKIAQVLGKEAAVFYPSGTMAQQIALRIWCDEKQIKRVAYHPLCHLEIHEQDGLKELHGIETILLGATYRLFTLEDLQTVTKPLSAVLIELPQREIGGQLPTFGQLIELSNYCREQKIALHLDGARLFETLPYYEKEASELCDLFDSVYISFYKGFGAVSGAILAGSKAFCETSKVWKRRYGGDLYSLYPYIIPADYCYEMRKDKMADYYKAAVTLAKRLNECPHVLTIPEVPVTNMFHLHFDIPKEVMEMILASMYVQSGVALRPSLKGTPIGCYLEISVGDALLEIQDEVIGNGIEVLKKLLSNI